MKLKLLILIMILPFNLMAAQTNVSDNVLIRNNFQFTGGVVGSGKVLTSDAVGYYTPQSIQALGGFAYTNQNNFFTTASTNTFNALTRFTAPIISSGASNVWGYASGQTNIFGSTTFFGTNSYPDTGAMIVVAPNNGKSSVDFLYGTTLYFGDPFTADYSYMSQIGDTFRINNNSTGPISFRKGGTAKVLIDTSSMTIGDNSSYQLITVGTTWTAANGINYNSGGLYLPSSITGVSTNGFSTNSFTGNIIANRGVTYPPLALTPSTSVNLDFAIGGVQFLANTTNVTFTESNVAAGRWVTLIVTNDANARIITWPAWKAYANPLPAGLQPSKSLIVTIYHTGTTEASGRATVGEEQ